MKIGAHFRNFIENSFDIVTDKEIGDERELKLNKNNKKTYNGK